MTARSLAPLGPRSLLWRYAADWRALFPGPAAGLLQLAHPALGAGVAEHSAFFDEPAERISRSVPQIWATIFASDGASNGRRIRDLHRDISGVDHAGRAYHALDPDTFWWAHATFTWEIFRSIELYHPRRLDAAQCEQLYAETVTWYSRYAVSMRPVPRDYAAFRAKFDAICREQLEPTPAVVRAIEVMRGTLPVLPRDLTVAPLVNVLSTPIGRVVVRGTLPAVVRERLGMPWSLRDAATMHAFRTSITTGFSVVPRRLNSLGMQTTQRYVGARTRTQRPQPATNTAR
jgi:uncharacterized protein (DUF2236 family)